MTRKARASRVERPWRLEASANWTWLGRSYSQRATATVKERRPASRRTFNSGARFLSRRRRRATQVFFRPRSFETAVGLRWSSSISEATTRASSMALEVLLAPLASRSRAFRAMPLAVSTTTGTSPWPSPAHRARRLNPSMTSKCPSPESATRRGSGARSTWRSVRLPRSGARLMRRRETETSWTRVIGGRPRRGGSGRAGSGRR